jgi:Protein of unknown function (DUF2418)
VTLDSPVTYSPGFFSTLTAFQPFRPSTPTLSEDGSKAQVWQLSIWDPSTFSLNTFWYTRRNTFNSSWFSPLHLLIIEYLSQTSLFAAICILTLNTIQVLPIPDLLTQLSLLISFATTQQKDKTTLYTQVLSEYDTKFIEPRISVKKRDIGTSTPTFNTPESTPLQGDTGTVEARTPTYGATGASLEGFRRKYGVEHTPLPRKTHSVSVGPESPPVGKFDLWSAGGTDFPSPVKKRVGEGSSKLYVPK